MTAAFGVAILTAIVFFAIFARSPDLTVLCSNNRESCIAVVEDFNQSRGYRVKLLRVSTSQALDRLRGGTQEFDVWIGGPTSAYATAEREGFLEPSGLEVKTRSASMTSGAWFEIYGGILSLCVADGIEIDSWDELTNPDFRIVAPSPLTSGTAGTFLSFQHLRLGNNVTPYLRQLHTNLVTYTDSGIAPAHIVAIGHADVGITFAPYCERLRADGAKVHTVFPKEGTDYEVGGAALLHGARNREIGIEFLEYVTSEEGQRIGARAGHQVPIISSEGHTLDDQLSELEVPLLRTDPRLLAEILPGLVDAWRREVYHARS
ncbi:extracellular solute-binding protein [Trueperella bonasi]|nr:extracellular solute-binding protein [Trueperella bonasi]